MTLGAGDAGCLVYVKDAPHYTSAMPEFDGSTHKLTELLRPSFICDQGVWRDPTVQFDDFTRWQADHYDVSAEDYERRQQLPRVQVLHERYARKFFATQLPSDGPILEIGCGGGWITQMIADPTRPVLATEISHASLQLARARLANNPNVVL